ncbi:MAG TPA: phosphoribosylglycinamide formyltransferase [Geminicoccaceae bacterium]|nr:phosphoribosylglycinamide formyltransferase [Geminicoccaceae bacterium]
MAARRRRVAVLISGGGTNLQALIDACRRPESSAEIVRAISDRPDAYGLTRAERAGIPALAIDRRAHRSGAAFEAALQASLAAARAELVCLAGFMRVLGPGFVAAWRDRMLNIHPSLLPAFRGLRTHERALEAGVRLTGCTVHVVRPEVDSGPIVVQAAVPVLPDDDRDTLAARVLEAEHRCYPLGLELFAAGRARVVGERVVIEGALHPTAPLINPQPAPA